MIQETKQYGFVDKDEVEKWKNKYPIGSRVSYLERSWTITSNQKYNGTSDNGRVHWVRDLCLERINEHGQYERVNMYSQDACSLVTNED